MDDRRCGSCGATKPVGEFNWRRKSKNQRDSMCRLCRAEYKRAHCEANKQRYVDNAIARRKRIGAERMRLIVEYLRAHPCVDCGEDDVLVLEFDHRGDKLFGISIDPFEPSSKKWRSATSYAQTVTAEGAPSAVASFVRR
jgi:hypothetical protein